MGTRSSRMTWANIAARKSTPSSGLPAVQCSSTPVVSAIDSRSVGSTALSVAAMPFVPFVPSASSTVAHDLSTNEQWSVYQDVPTSESACLTPGSKFLCEMRLMGQCYNSSTFEASFGQQLDKLPDNKSFRLFRAAVEPKWEAVENQGHGAGKWTVFLDDMWSFRVAFRVIMTEMMRGSLPHVNGLIGATKGDSHKLVLWTVSHKGKKASMDVFGVNNLHALISQSVGPVKSNFRFKPHTSDTSRPRQPQIRSRPAVKSFNGGGVKAMLARGKVGEGFTQRQAFSNVANLPARVRW